MDLTSREVHESKEEIDGYIEEVASSICQSDAASCFVVAKKDHNIVHSMNTCYHLNYSIYCPVLFALRESGAVYACH